MATFPFGRYKLKWLAVTTHPPRPDGACELQMAVHQGTAMSEIREQRDACLFTIARFAFCGIRLFAPNGANPCDNLYLELRLFDTAQQHRTDCHENEAAKGTTVLGQ
jgi:hypothetical protein